MLSFLRNFSAALTALFVFFVFVPLSLLMFLLGLIGAITGKSGDSQAKVEGVLVIDLSRPLTEFPKFSNSINIFTQSKAPNISTYKMCSSIRTEVEDEGVKAVLLCGRIEDSGASLAQIAELRDAVALFKGKKKIYAYLENPALRDYFMASVADEIILNPFSTFELNGLATNSPFFGAAFAKYGFDAQIIRSGNHKSFGDIFTRSQMDLSDKKILQSVLDSIWGTLVDKICIARNMERGKLLAFVNERVACSAQEAKAAGFVDSLMYADELEDSLKQKYGEVADSFAQIEIVENANASTTANTVIVYMRGDIVESAQSSYFIAADRYVEILRNLRADKNVKNVVLRIDSGGGSAYASELIRREVELLAREKKVVASFGSVAASGAYWIATGAQKIYLDAETITGSIGVFSLGFSMEKFASGHGVDFDGVKTSPFADMDTLTRAKTPAEIKIEAELVTNIYDRFVSLVSASRKIDIEQLKSIADGRIFSGEEAVKLKLADAIASLDVVVLSLSEGGECDVIECPRIDKFKELLENIESMDEFAFAMPARAKNFRKILDTLSIYSNPRGIFARLPYNIELK